MDPDNVIALRDEIVKQFAAFTTSNDARRARIVYLTVDLLLSQPASDAAAAVCLLGQDATCEKAAELLTTFITGLISEDADHLGVLKGMERSLMGKPKMTDATMLRTNAIAWFEALVALRQDATSVALLEAAAGNPVSSGPPN